MNLIRLLGLVIELKIWAKRNICHGNSNKTLVEWLRFVCETGFKLLERPNYLTSFCEWMTKGGMRGLEKGETLLRGTRDRRLWNTFNTCFLNDSKIKARCFLSTCQIYLFGYLPTCAWLRIHPFHDQYSRKKQILIFVDTYVHLASKSIPPNLWRSRTKFSILKSFINHVSARTGQFYYETKITVSTNKRTTGRRLWKPVRFTEIRNQLNLSVSLTQN